jgi:hypothetical protein
MFILYRTTAAGHAAYALGSVTFNDSVSLLADDDFQTALSRIVDSQQYFRQAQSEANRVEFTGESCADGALLSLQEAVEEIMVRA